MTDKNKAALDALNEIRDGNYDYKQSWACLSYHIDTIRAALANAPERVTGWQPIETAPRDGEQFLVTDGECVVMAEWPNKEIWVHDITVHRVFADHAPTHWMPLPKPPVVKD